MHAPSGLLDRDGMPVCSCSDCGLQLPPPAVPLAQLLPRRPLRCRSGARAARRARGRPARGPRGRPARRTRGRTARGARGRAARGAGRRPARGTRRRTRCYRRCPLPPPLLLPLLLPLPPPLLLPLPPPLLLPLPLALASSIVPGGPPSGPGPTPTAVSPTSVPAAQAARTPAAARPMRPTGRSQDTLMCNLHRCSRRGRRTQLSGARVYSPLNGMRRGSAPASLSIETPAMRKSVSWENVGFCRFEPSF